MDVQKQCAANDNIDNLLRSPQAMADAVVADAIARRARPTQPTQDDCQSITTAQDDSHQKQCFSKASNLSNHTVDDKVELMELMDRDVEDNEKQQATMRFLSSRIESLIQEGLRAFHDCESAKRELTLAKEEINQKQRDVQRLRSCEEASQKTISNLLRAVEKSKNVTRESSRSVQVEAKLRSTLSSLRTERDDALGLVASLKRKNGSLEEDIRVNRLKISRLDQEKIKIQRDSRAAMSFAKSLGSETSSDIDFYKRKISDLENQLSSQHVLAAEQNAEIDDMRRQQERSMSQHRLASMRAEELKGRKSF
eukprot:CAMPEP_0194201048 /NCGR_PEP_ID=MMETSP0156-20130528/1429_1 /TAXON_ID=33649 /ORGANISM="Thalassionema nitzschioides, Strain L26-B" /LENGTH=309 /DNA_ID=CAMNT_0038926149 /DNA_START=52 /DNA_END=981 /DNA_ORIENTATION=-